MTMGMRMMLVLLYNPLLRFGGFRSVLDRMMTTFCPTFSEFVYMQTFEHFNSLSIPWCPPLTPKLSRPSIEWQTRPHRVPPTTNKPNLLPLMLLHLLPQPIILLNLDRRARIELIETTQIHVLRKQRDHVLVESLPVWILEVVSAWGNQCGQLWSAETR